jgi:hypothetical protein
VDTTHLMDLAAAQERAGLWQQATENYDRVLAQAPAHPGALSRRVALGCEHGELEAVTAHLLRAAAHAPEVIDLQRLVARMLLGLARTDAAAGVLRAAIERAPMLDLMQMLAEALLPGPTYYQHLAWLHALLAPRTYLEIGIWYGHTLGLAKPPTRVFGVDPEPRVDAAGLAAATRIFPITSDAFFETRAWEAVDGPWGGVDLAFIDGLHRFEQVLRDFIHVERHAAPGAVVVFHDTLPLTAVSAERDPIAPMWSGDVWKILPCLERHRPDLRIVTLPTGPSGLSVVTGLDPRSSVLADRFDAIVADCASLPYATHAARLPAMIAAHANDRATLARAIGATADRS